MSQQNPAIAVAVESADDSTETKPSFFKKSKAFVKNHKKPAIAVGALVALVGASALLGNKTATVTVQSPVELDVYDEDEVSTETETA